MDTQISIQDIIFLCVKTACLPSVLPSPYNYEPQENTLCVPLFSLWVIKLYDYGRPSVPQGEADLISYLNYVPNTNKHI